MEVNSFPENWVCELCSKMRRYGIKFKDLAAELGYSQQWVSGVVNGKVKEPKNACDKFNEALDRLVERKISV